jgi:hypothetical protein
VCGFVVSATANPHARTSIARSTDRRAETWPLLRLFVVVFLIGLVFASLAAGISEAIYDST